MLIFHLNQPFSPSWRDSSWTFLRVKLSQGPFIVSQPAKYQKFFQACSSAARGFSIPQPKMIHPFCLGCSLRMWDDLMLHSLNSQCAGSSHSRSFNLGDLFPLMLPQSWKGKKPVIMAVILICWLSSGDDFFPHHQFPPLVSLYVCWSLRLWYWKYF